MASSVATMKIDHKNHSRWRDASRSFQACRPHILFTVPEQPRLESSASDGATRKSETSEHPRLESAASDGAIGKSEMLDCSCEQGNPQKVEMLRRSTSQKVRKHAASLSLSQPESPTSPRSRQHPKILERWTSLREPSGAVTVERKAHEEELSALSAASEPVMARAATLLHEIETSPTHQAAAEVVGGGETGGFDSHAKLRASSLIQMWREIEADRAVIHPAGGSPNEERRDSFEDESWWESDLTGAGVEIEEQGCVGRKMMGVATEPIGRKKSGGFGGWPCLRGRHEVQKLFDKFVDERRMELGSLIQQRHVSGFVHRGRMQTFLRYRSLRRPMPDKDLRPQSTAQELDQLNRGIAILSLRQQFSPRPQQDCKTVSTTERKHVCDVPLSSNSLTVDTHNFIGIESSTKYHEADIERELHDMQSEKSSISSESEELQDGSQHSDVAWEEESSQSQESNIDWEKPLFSLNSNSMPDEVFIEENNNANDWQIEEAKSMCLANFSPSQRDLDRCQNENYSDVLQSYSDNVDIRELLERRTVSTSLASDFRDTLDQVLLSSLRRRRLGPLVDENFIHENAEQLLRIHDHEFAADYQGTSSFSPATSSSQTFAQQQILKRSSFNSPVAQMDAVLDMKKDIASIHREMGELRKLLENYLGNNASHHSIQQDETTIFRRSVSMGRTYSSEREPTKKGSCCICYEKQIDSLLYRCGHMCTCFKCAHELLCGNGKCPVCKSPIMDVVQANTELLIPN